MIIFDPLLGKLTMHPPPGAGSPSTLAAEHDVFTATDGQTVFPLSFPMLAGSAIVTINGLRQAKTEYVASGQTVTFNDGTGILAGFEIVVSYLR